MNHDPNKPEQPGKEPQDFERDLEAVQSAWEAMEKAEPPDLVDQAVLNTARRDLEPPKEKRPLRWLGGFATAAVVVLAVSVVVQQNQTVPEPPSLENGGVQMDAARERRMNASPAMKLEKSPLPSADPAPQTREAKRPKQDLRASPEAPDKASQQPTIVVPPIRPEQFIVTPRTPPADADRETDLAEAAVLADAADDAPEEEQAPRSAEAWIERMVVLRDNGQMKRLAGEIAAFRHYYPDYPLPEDLLEKQP